MPVICLFPSLLNCYMTTPVLDGYASQYADHIMEATIDARQGWGHLPYYLEHYDVFGAVADCGRIGDEFLVQYDNQWYLGLATDCAGHIETVEWMDSNRILIEVDYDTAVEWNVVGQGGVEIDFAWVISDVPIERCSVAM